MQGQRAAFELRDLSRLVLQIHSHHELGKTLAHQRRPFLQSSGGIQVRVNYQKFLQMDISIYLGVFFNRIYIQRFRFG